MLLVEDAAHGAAAVFGAGTPGGGVGAPGERLGVEVIEVGERTRGEETVARKAHDAFYATLFVAPIRCDRPGGKAVVGGEFEQGWVEADGIAAAFEHDAAKVVVEQSSGDAVEVGEGIDMAAQEIVHLGVEVEAQATGAGSS